LEHALRVVQGTRRVCNGGAGWLGLSSFCHGPDGSAGAVLGVLPAEAERCAKRAGDLPSLHLRALEAGRAGLARAAELDGLALADFGPFALAVDPGAGVLSSGPMPGLRLVSGLAAERLCSTTAGNCA
jgi:hypothetical protein